jgi:hypothetical protein
MKKGLSCNSMALSVQLFQNSNANIAQSMIENLVRLTCEKLVKYNTKGPHVDTGGRDRRAFSGTVKMLKIPFLVHDNRADLDGAIAFKAQHFRRNITGAELDA